MLNLTPSLNILGVRLSNLGGGSRRLGSCLGTLSPLLMGFLFFLSINHHVACLVIFLIVSSKKGEGSLFVCFSVVAVVLREGLTMALAVLELTL